MSLQVREIARKIKDLETKDPVRVELGGELLEKL